MARILDCTRPQSNIHYEKIVTINLDTQDSLPMEEPQFVSRNDDFIDLNIQINDKTAISVDISNSGINEDFQELTEMNIVDNANLKQVTVNVETSDSAINEGLQELNGKNIVDNAHLKEGLRTLNMETSDSDINEGLQELNGMNIVENANLKEGLVTVNMETSDSQINEGLQEFNGMNIMENANLKEGLVTVNMETSDSEINEDFQEFSRMNIAENAKLRQALVAALSSGICDDISRFNREQKCLFNVQWSQVHNQACTDGSVKCELDAKVDAKESFYPSAKVEVGKSSFPLAEVKVEPNSFPFANIKTEIDTSDTATASSSEAETTLESPVDVQPCDDLGQHTGSAPTVIKREPCGDKVEADYDQTEINGLRRLEMNNIKVCKVLMSRKNVLSSSDAYPVALAKSMIATNPSLKRARLTDGSTPQTKVPRIMTQKITTHKLAISQTHCIVCNRPCFITENRKFPKLPFCRNCKKSYSYQRSRRYATNKSICRSGGACRIDYRQPKMCSRCHYIKFLAVMSAAQKAFKEPFKQQISRQYRHTEVLQQKKHDWSIIRDEFLLQEALLFQPKVVLKRIDDPTSSSWHCASKVQPYRTASPIHGGNIDTAGKTETMDPAVFGDMDVEEAQREIASSVTSGCLSESVQKTKMLAAGESLVKDRLNQHGDIVADRLISRYSGRVIRRINLDSYGHGTLHPVAKQRHSRLRKKSACDPSKISVFMCGHACGVCNGKDAAKWLKDHGYSKNQPLKDAICGETQKIMKDGTSLKAALILNKLFEFNELLQGSSNLCLELKNRPLQHASLTGTSIPAVDLPVGSPTLENKSDVLMLENSTLEVSGGTSLSKSLTREDLSDTGKAPQSKSSFYRIGSDTINISLPKGSAWTFSGDTISITLPKSSSKISSDLVKTSLSTISTNAARSTNKISRDAINTSLSKSPTHEISSDAINSSLSKSPTHEISSGAVKASLPESSTYEISNGTISTLLSKSSTQKISSDTTSTSLSTRLTHESSFGSIKALLSKPSNIEVSRDAVNPWQSKMPAHESSSDMVNTSLSQSSTQEISIGAVKISLPDSITFEISRDRVKTSLSKSSAHEISSGVIKTLSKSLPKEINNDAINSSLPKSPVQKISKDAVKTSLPKNSTHVISKYGWLNYQISNGTLKTSLPKSSPQKISSDTTNTSLSTAHESSNGAKKALHSKPSNNEVSRGAVKSWQSKMPAPKSSNDKVKMSLTKMSVYELSNGVFKPVQPKIPAHTFATGGPKALTNSSTDNLGQQPSQHSQIVINSPSAPQQPVMCFLLPVCTGSQLPMLLPKSFLIQHPQQPAEKHATNPA